VPLSSFALVPPPCTTSNPPRPRPAMTTVPEWPLRSLDECNKLLTAPGSPWETEHKVIKGRPLTVYKHLPHSLRDFWLATKVSVRERRRDGR
jgi:hypothetical protein